MHLKRALGSIFCLALLTSCGGLFKTLLEPPKAEFKNVQVESIQGDLVSAKIIGDVENPNREDLRFSSLEYSLKVDGRLITNEVVNTSTVLKAKQKTQVVLPIRFKLSDVLSTGLKVILAGKAAYLLEGSATISMFKLPFKEAGEFDLQKILDERSRQ